MVASAEIRVAAAGYEIGSVDLKPDCYKFQWPTETPNRELFVSTRAFLTEIRNVFGEVPPSLATGNKLFPPGVEIFNAEGHGEGMDLEEFMDEQGFAARVRSVSAVCTRIDTPYGDVMMDFEENAGERLIHVASHLNLSPQLAHFVIETHKDQLTPNDEPLILFGKFFI